MGNALAPHGTLTSLIMMSELHNMREYSRDRWSARELLLGKLQGAYDAMGGLWPFVSMELFETVTGPKPEEWLVRAVAGVLLFLGGLLLHDAFVRKRIDRGLRIMAGGVSGVLALVALVSSVGGWISWVYLLDGLAHLSFAAGWVLVSLHRSRTRDRSPGSGQ